MALDSSEVQKIVKSIAPLLAGHPAGVQGAVLADLLATWLAGHQGPDGLIDKAREEILELHIKMVREMLPMSDAIIKVMKARR